MAFEIRIERAYVSGTARFGRRLLVERLWPRGISKADLKIDAWLKDVAPSTELRKWFAHDPERWEEFCSRYADELDARPDAVAQLYAELEGGPLTFVYGSKEERFNSANALKAYVESGRARRG